jgi:malate dehydrogenase (oxaloacetate-decarboxylating)(NADP+)
MSQSPSFNESELFLREAALQYHRYPRPGKIETALPKQLRNKDDLALAYSPGVAYPCLEIQADPRRARDYTARANLVGVITNGTAVLGLGNIGPLASKPVMEGKAGLFKQFAGLDVFDIELAETDPDRLVDIVAALEPTLGGINLEDIRAPECFYIERKLQERVAIPVFHDDQHGTAIIATAALMNAAEIAGKDLADLKLVVSGAGAASLACVEMMLAVGVRQDHVIVVDSKGVIHAGRENLEASKARFAAATPWRTLYEAIAGTDAFLGCSSGGVLKPQMLMSMARDPIVLALANPEPEIRPEIALASRPDAILATGRSDYPNQVNNVLCFPYIFRGALDVGATCITQEMKIACVRELAALAKERSGESGADADFGRDHFIPDPFDPRLLPRLAVAVARAAQECGVATRPRTDLAAYRQQLQRWT